MQTQRNIRINRGNNGNGADVKKCNNSPRNNASRRKSQILLKLTSTSVLLTGNTS